MNKIKQILENRWGLPYEKACQVESIAQNIQFVKNNTDLIDSLEEAVGSKGAEVQRLLDTPPFKYFGDRRYQIFIYATVLKPGWMLRIDEDGYDDTTEYNVTEQVYWNYYSSLEEALNKYAEKKGECTKGRDSRYGDVCGCPLFGISIKLIEVIDGKESKIHGDSFFFQEYKAKNYPWFH